MSSPSLGKASKVIKMDMVKPIPPNIPAPIMSFQRNSLGKEQMPRLTAKNENNQIPKGFPITKPAIIPTELEFNRPSCQSPVIGIPVLAIANKGRIKKATGLCKKCCKR